MNAKTFYRNRITGGITDNFNLAIDWFQIGYEIDVYYGIQTDSWKQETGDSK